MDNHLRQNTPHIASHGLTPQSQLNKSHHDLHFQAALQLHSSFCISTHQLQDVQQQLLNGNYFNTQLEESLPKIRRQGWFVFKARPPEGGFKCSLLEPARTSKSLNLFSMQPVHLNPIFYQPVFPQFSPFDKIINFAVVCFYCARAPWYISRLGFTYNVTWFGNRLSYFVLQDWRNQQKTF